MIIRPARASTISEPPPSPAAIAGMSIAASFAAIVGMWAVPSKPASKLMP